MCFSKVSQGLLVRILTKFDVSNNCPWAYISQAFLVHTRGAFFRKKHFFEKRFSLTFGVDLAFLLPVVRNFTIFYSTQSTIPKISFIGVHIRQVKCEHHFPGMPTPCGSLWNHP